MTGQIFKILFEHDKGFLIPGKPMSFAQLGLPETAIPFRSSAYWTIKVLNHIENEQKLFCEIISYNNGVTNFPSNQIAFAEELGAINKVSYRTIDTGGFVRTQYSTSPGTILPTKEEPVFRSERKLEPIQNTFNEPYQSTGYKSIQIAPFPTIVGEPIKRTVTQTFFVYIKDIRFKLGCVSFDRKFNEFDKPVELTIKNDDIKEEFDPVKNYFANVLKTKKIQVTASIEFQGKDFLSASAISPEIDRINKGLIEEVKYVFIKAIKKKPGPDLNKNLFTMEEYFETISVEKVKAKAFYNNENEFFEDLIKISNTKHYRNLRFLSSRHNHEKMKLRFIHKPFSYVFLIEGNNNYHLLWETLDTTEATYIWHIEKDLQALKDSLKKIDDIITLIKTEGKTAYITTTEDPLTRIFHDYADNDYAFLKWKGELEIALT